MKVMPNRHAVALGKLGRAVNSEAQKEASRKNGLKGGRPAKYPKPKRRRRRLIKGLAAKLICVECGRLRGHARDGKCSKGWPPNNAEGRRER